jgi:hypothetical protein
VARFARLKGIALEYNFVVPVECLRYMRLQRTRCNVSRIPEPDKAISGYADWVHDDYKTVQHALPAAVRSIVGIGCGIGAFELLLQRRYPQARLTLLDGDGLAVHHAGTKDETSNAGWHSTDTAVYNDRAATEKFFAANGGRIDAWLPVGTRERVQADLIVSLHSWGFHYPLSTYDAHGMIIADLRRRIPENDKHIGMLDKYSGRVLWEGPKFDRCLWVVP